MIKVGITGGIGTGKSICCKVFQQFGTPIYDADSEAKKLMESDKEIVSGLISIFGENIYVNDRLDRPAMAKKIFSNKDLLQEVNKVVHPRVRAHFKDWCVQKEAEGYPYLVYEAAILFESGFYKEMDTTILVLSPLELRIQRAMKRDGAIRADIEKRIANQWSDLQKMELADSVVGNNNTELLVPQIVELHNGYINQGNRF